MNAVFIKEIAKEHSTWNMNISLTITIKDETKGMSL
jgi:hypothetical protein